MTRQAVEFTSVTLSVNPVNAGSTFIISVGLHDFTHGYWENFTHTQLESKTHDEMSGNI